MPNLTLTLLKYLVDQPRTSYEVIIPEDEKGLQPLCAVYSRSVLPLAEDAIEQGQLSMQTFVEKIDARVVNIEKWASQSKVHDPFANFNTPEEYSAGHKKAP